MKRFSYIIIVLFLGFAFHVHARIINVNHVNSNPAFSNETGKGMLESLVAPLSGNFTIGPTGDYTTISAAVADLFASGIDGPVTFDIASGTYNEQVVIPAIAGASDVNTITFQSASADSTDVILTYASSDVNLNYTLNLNGADYVSFKYITIKATGTTYGRIVEITNGSTFNSIENSIVTGVAGLDELIYAHSTIDDNLSNVFAYNVFENGKEGIKYLGANSTTGVEVSNNQFSNQTENAMYVSYCDGPVIDGNEITSDQAIDAIFIQDTGVRNAIVSNNKILLSSGGNGIVFEFEINGPSHAAEESLIFNNFIYIHTTNNDYGIYMNMVSVIAKIFYNTIHIAGDNTSSATYYTSNRISPWNLDVKNNILVNEAYGSLFSGDNSNFSCDYNDLYTNGASIGFLAETLEEWQSTYNKGQHSVFANPYFVSNTSWQVRNPLVNGAAIPVTEVTTDIDGEARDAAMPDLGADEFTPAPAPLNGSYTIGGGSPDYTTINKAVEDVVVNGVSGPVTFNIASGTYTEQISIQEIAGVSATNTVTFQSASEDSTDVLITYTPPNTTHNYILQLNGADYIIFKNLSVTVGNEYSWAVHLKNEATHNQFLNNRFFYEGTMTYDFDRAFIYSKGSLDIGNVFISNVFDNNVSGIFMDGTSLSGPVSGTQIKQNIFTNIQYRGIYLNKHSNIEITGNQFSVESSASTGAGIFIADAGGIIANNFVSFETSDDWSGWGIRTTGSD